MNTCISFEGIKWQRLDHDIHVAGDAAIMTHDHLVIMCRWQGIERQRLDHHIHVAGDREANGM